MGRTMGVNKKVTVLVRIVVELELVVRELSTDAGAWKVRTARRIAEQRMVWYPVVKALKAQ